LVKPQTLVLIPGLNNTAAVFDRLQSCLREVAPSIQPIALDNPALESVDAIAQAHLQRLPDRFWLAGFSFGGYVAMALLAIAPERVQGVAMLCTAPCADPPEAAARRHAGIDAALAGRYFEMIDAQGAQAFHPDSLKDPQLMQERHAMVRAYGPDRFVAHVRATVARPDRTDLLDGGRPTLVVGGSNDTLFTPASLSAWADSIPGVQRVTIEGAGHLVPMERPRALAQTLHNWITAA